MLSIRRAALAAPLLVLLQVTLVAGAPAKKPPAASPRPATTPAASAPPKAAPANTAKPGGLARPADERLDAIAAMVNDEPVLASDVEEQLFLFLQQSGMRPDSTQVDTLRRQVLDQLINTKLVVAEAKRQGLTATEPEVAKQVDTAIDKAKERFGGDEGFAEQLRRENTTESRLREQYRSDLLLELLADKLKRKLFPTRTVPAPEAEAYFVAHRDKFPKMPAELRLAVIQIAPSPDSLALAAGLAKAQALRKRILAGEKFAKLAQESSDDPGSAKAGGDLGFFRKGQMEPALDAAAFSLKIGEVSPPVRSAYGWHLVQVIERDTTKESAPDSSGKTQPVPEAHARHLLVKVAPTQADIDRTVEVAKKVRDQAVKGVNFGTLVRRYSSYDGPANADGDVGFVSLGSLQPHIRAALDSLEIGQVSEVLPNQAGLNIFKVVDRHPEREYQLSEIKNDLPDAVAQVQFREKYDAWIKTLRSKAQIEYRP